jgi:hypothetical protein
MLGTGWTSVNRQFVSQRDAPALLGTGEHTILGKSLSGRNVPDSSIGESHDCDRVKSRQQRGHQSCLSEVGLDGLDAELGVVQGLGSGELDRGESQRENDWSEYHFFVVVVVEKIDWM